MTKKVLTPLLYQPETVSPYLTGKKSYVAIPVYIAVVNSGAAGKNPRLYVGNKTQRARRHLNP